jgi:squalene cyclase
MSALEWLKNHQSPDGHWDSDGFSEMCKKNTCDGPGSGVHDVGMTGLALLCFLGAGETHEGGPYKNTVKNGLKYLIEVQDDDGCFGPRSGTQFLYNHACAALAMAEAFGMTGAKPFREPAQKGIFFIQRAQNPYNAWRYAYPPDGDNDTSVTGWMVMVLKSGKLSELDVDQAAFANAMNWINEMTDSNTGRTGYTGTPADSRLVRKRAWPSSPARRANR